MLDIPPGVARRTLVSGLLSAWLLGRSAGPASGSDQRQPVDLGYRRTDYQLRVLAEADLPYAVQKAEPLINPGASYDPAGVTVRVLDGTSYDHPVLQAQFMLSRLGSYRHNADPAYLTAVLAHADRLVGRGVTARGALYLPYPFDFPLHGDRADLMTAPWFSGMAQGQALSAFVRLYQVTGDARHLATAEALFASLTQPRAAGVPWVVDLLEGGNLWFEEYAKHPGADRTLNGHIFAIFGLYDYWLLTQDQVARELAQGGITALELVLPQIRRPGWISRYCLTHGTPSPRYHALHVSQLYALHSITGVPALAAMADTFLQDYPSAQAGGPGYLAAGALDAAVFNRWGTVLDRKVFQLSTPERVTMGARHKITGQTGIWLRVDSGTLAGFWVREVPGQAYLRATVELFRFTPARTLRLAAGWHDGYEIDESGPRPGPRRVTLPVASAAACDRRAVIDGQLYFRVSNGLLANRWIAAGAGVTVG